MKKIFALFLTLCLTFLLAACGSKDTNTSSSEPVSANSVNSISSSEPKPEKISIRYADVQAENDSETLFARKFAELVSNKSGGRISVEVYPNGSMGEMADILNSVQMGALEMCRTNPSWLADAGAPAMNLLSLPFVFEDIDHANRVLDGEIGGSILQELTDNGLGVKGLGYLQPSGRYFFFTNKKVASLSDIAGLKIRVPTNSLATSMVDNLGASATPISYNELYSSLQTNIVDGADNPLKGILNMSFFEVSSSILDMAHQYEASVVLISDSFWNKLSAEDQTVLQESMNEAAAYYKELENYNQEEYRSSLSDEGITFVTPDNIQEWVDVVQPTVKEFGAGYEDILSQINTLKDN